VRLRLDAVIRAKCGDMQRAPFRWYETVPMLLHKGSIETLIAMARQADASLQEEFGLPLILIIIDTIAACAGYARAGDENDPAAGQAVMNVLKAVAQAIGCFVLGVDHFGKNLEAGTRGASSKEAAGDLVLACLGDKELSGNVINTRLAVRKNRGASKAANIPSRCGWCRRRSRTRMASRSAPWWWTGCRRRQAGRSRSWIPGRKLGAKISALRGCG
jgi:AAA domain